MTNPPSFKTSTTFLIVASFGFVFVYFYNFWHLYFVSGYFCFRFQVNQKLKNSILSLPTSANLNNNFSNHLHQSEFLLLSVLFLLCLICPFPKRSCITILPTFKLASTTLELPELLETGFNRLILAVGLGWSYVKYFGGVPAVGFANLNLDLSISPKTSISITGL